MSHGEHPGLKAAQNFDVQASSTSAVVRAVMHSGTEAPKKSWGGAILILNVAIAVALVLWLSAPTPTLPISHSVTHLQQFGPYVLAFGSEDAELSAEYVSSSETRLRLHKGRVTVRLTPHPGPYTLSVLAGELSANAKGTVYTVAMVGNSAEAYVHEGEVKVFHLNGDTMLLPGMGINDRGVVVESSAPQDEVFAQRLLDTRPRALSPQMVQKSAPPTPPLAKAVTSSSPSASLPKNAETLWRASRVAQAEGQYERALQDLNALVAMKNKEWSPMALVELMRLQQKRGNWAKVESLGEEFLSTYAIHSLHPDVKRRLCEAQGAQNKVRSGFCKF